MVAAATAVRAGHVKINGEAVKPSQQVVLVADAAWVADNPVVRTVMADLAEVLTTRATPEFEPATVVRVRAR